MAANRRILTARRSYEFSMDSIRLSVLSLPYAQEMIKQAFSFQVVTIGTPQATFGAVPHTLPPGLVFNLGVWQATGDAVPIRFIHIEQRRIVIDVAGPSNRIGDIYEHLWELLAALQAPDGSSALGISTGLLDYTEITAEYLFSLETLIEPNALVTTLEALANAGLMADRVIVPTLSLQIQTPEDEYQGLSIDNRLIQIGIRAGTRPGDHVYFSAAPFDSDSHIAYLDRLERMTTHGKRSKRTAPPRATSA